MDGVAIKVMLVPAHCAPVGVGAILTVGVNSGFTVLVMLLDVAVADEGQVALVVITQVTICPLVSEVVV